MRAILLGAVPEAPPIGPQTRVTALGGGFAARLAAWLCARGYDALVADDALSANGAAGLADSLALRQALERAWEARRRTTAAEAARAILDRTDVFVLNLEQAEVWREAPAGAAADPGQRRLRIPTVAETKQNLRAICRLIRARRPSATILLTLGTGPQAVTCRDASCIGASAAARAVLRAAIDEVLREGASGVSYWPACEIARDVFAWRADAERMQPPEEVTQATLALFGQVWCAGAGLPPLAPAWTLACAVSGMLPQRMAQIVLSRRPRQLRLYLAQEKLTEDPQQDAALRALGAGAIAGWQAAGV